MFGFKKVSPFPVLGAILVVGISSTPAQALNIVSGSVSGIWEYDFDGPGGLNAGDSFTADYTYDSDSITETDYSYPGYYNYKGRIASLLSLVLNSGSYSYTFDLSSYNSIIWTSWQSTSSSYGLWDYEVTELSATDYLASATNNFYAYRFSGVDFSGDPYNPSFAQAYSYDSNAKTYLIGAYSYGPIRFSGATPAPNEIPTPALLPGLVGMGVAAWRKRKGEAAVAQEA